MGDNKHDANNYSQPREIRLVDSQQTPPEDTVGGYVKSSLVITLKFFAAKLVASLMIGVISAIVFALLKMPLPWLWGLIAGVGNAIPVVGQWVSSILVVVILLLIEPVYALYALVTLLALQVLDEFLISPLIIGQAISLKPLAVIIVTLLAGSLFGVWGVIFAVPVAACLKLAVEIILRRRARKAQRD